MTKGLREETVVAALIGAGMLTCAAVALAIRPDPLPGAARERWSTIVAAQAAGDHLAGRTFTIDGVTVGGRERPYRGDPVRVPPGARLEIHGWALDPASLAAASGFAYSVDGGPWLPAQYHIARPDVAAAFGLPNAPDAGFSAVVATGGLGRGRHTIRLATTMTGTVNARAQLPQSVAVRL